MLNALRKSAGGFVAKIFIALLVLSFGIWGIADIFRGFRQDTIAKVGDAEVTIRAFQTAYQREVQNFSQRIGQPLSRQQAVNMGLPGQVLGRLVAEAAFDHIAQSLKVGISDKELVKQIHANPAFRGPDGRFDRNRLVQVLYANQLGEDQYVEQARKLAERRQVAEALTGAINPPETLLEAAHRFRFEERTINYVTLTKDSLPPIADPSADELETFFKDHTANYRAPEYRKLEILTVLPSDIAKPEDVSDADAHARYDADPDRFGTTEQRHVFQLTYTDPEKAKADEAKLKAGTGFEDLVKEHDLSLADVDLGLMTKDKIIDPSIADTAFSLEVNGVSDVIDGQFGPRIIKVTEIKPAATKPFEEVKDTLKSEIATKRAEDEVLSMHDEIEDARAGGATLAEIAKRFSLKLDTIDAIARDGTNPKGEKVTLPDAPDLLTEAFQTEPDDEAPPVPVGGRGYLWFDVADITPSRDRTLDEVREKVAADWKDEQVQQRLAASAEEMAKKLKDGADFSSLAEASEMKLETSQPFSRDRNNNALSAQAVTEAFTGPEGTVATADGADGGRIVLQVASVTTPAFFAESDIMTKLDNELSDMLQTSLISQFVTGVQDTIGVNINQAALSNAIGTSNE
ncbi:peptidyl-prolyl cis-trans isomerase D [Breoghania corrubedonensis]|uniref:Parvulin-like PPIase n=1 Tax=Breoghania corrubedonensis TaxID=665038 RepID=A0A2T5VBN6_9HYPH|nr:SurA N-terminal domain-containing protein [Breoghania corrubedonensis]PTW61159.1 peptidyl-prolyl cis-trans isomerase D [Breoghania corrubedonensis]